ncbi:MAG TPA: arylsulfatase [Candidatus Methylacidiphilales bacterium]
MKLRRFSRTAHPSTILTALGLAAGALTATRGDSTPVSTAPENQTTLPKAAPSFQGKIGVTVKDSVPNFPKPLQAPAGAPNVVVILIDDLGFGAPSTFGGIIDTPNLDKLAAQGLRYNRFHVTGLCSPTRAALLTGRNHHQEGAGVVTELMDGYPGYNGSWGKDIASLPEILKDNGYNTAAFGKWHNTPDWESGPAGPFDRWPTSKGFESFYGFLGGETSEWQPQLFQNTTPIEADKTPGQGYHLSVDLADKAITWLQTHEALAPEKPYFLYWAPGATHAPHQVPKEWADKFKGRFDDGWDKLREQIFAHQKEIGIIPADAKLTPRPAVLPAWDSLSADQKKVYARQMEVFAGFTAHLDAQIGRLLDEVEKGPNADNTLVIAILGDNGASAEGSLTGTLNEIGLWNGVHDDLATQLKRYIDIGGTKSWSHYAAGWAWATDAPFQWFKQIASHFGATRDGLIISWPKRIHDKGGLRTQFHHVIDIAPTIYEAAGITFPDAVDGVKQVPLAGISMAYTFDNAQAPGRRTTQYFEMLGNRAIYQYGWVAAARHGANPRKVINRPSDVSNDRWELYNIDKDYSEADDLAAQYPDKLKELQAVFDQEDRKDNVYPLDGSVIGRLLDPNRPIALRGRNQFTFYPGTVRIPERSAPNVKARSHRIIAYVDVPDAGASGVLLAEGGVSGGYTFYLKDGKLVYENNYGAGTNDVLTSTEPITPGKHQLIFEYTQEAPVVDAASLSSTSSRLLLGLRRAWSTEAGTAHLYIDGVPAGEAIFKHRIALIYSDTETFDVGEDLGSPVSQNYATPFAFTGHLEKLDIELK